MPSYGVNSAVLFASILVGWYLLNLFIARLTGWSTLGEHYSCPQQPKGEWFRFASVGFSRWSGYNGCITACVGAQGLYLSVWFFFRPGHNPLLIPWDAILHVTEHQLMFVKTTRVSLKEFDKDLYLRGSLARAVLDFAHMKGFSDSP